MEPAWLREAADWLDRPEREREGRAANVQAGGEALLMRVEKFEGMSDGQLVETLPGSIHQLYFSPDSAARFFVISYWGAPAEVRDHVAPQVPDRLERPQLLDEFLRRWEERLAFKDLPVSLSRDGHESVMGTILGLEDDGSLRLQVREQVIRVPSGEIRLRPSGDRIS